MYICTWKLEALKIVIYRKMKLHRNSFNLHSANEMRIIPQRKPVPSHHARLRGLSLLKSNIIHHLILESEEMIYQVVPT